MNLNPIAALLARRALANEDTYTPAELATLRENPAEAKSLRRHRRRHIRPQLLKGDVS